MRTSRLAAGTLIAGGAILFAISGCEGKKQTEVVPGFSTQVRVPRDMKSIRVDVRVSGEQKFCRSYRAFDGKVLLPKTLGLLALDDPRRPFTVQVAGFQVDITNDGAVSNCLDFRVSRQPGEARVVRRSTQAYVPEKIKYLPMPMRYSCFDVDCPTDAETCKGGVCVPSATSAESLSDYREDFVFGTTNTCFSTQRCMPVTVPAQVVDQSTCTFAMPFTPSAEDRGPKPAAWPPDPVLLGGEINVRLQWDGGYVSEILDLDPEEGFTVPDPVGKPQRFVLSPSLCKVWKANFGPADPSVKTPHRIAAIEVNARCASKTALQPMCEAEIPGTDSSDAGVDLSTQGGCSSLPALAPTKSALMVLIDQTTNMKDAFFSGDPQSGGSIIVALDKALQDPALLSTRATMQFYPTANGAAECTANPNPFARPAAEFLDSGAAKQDILTRIQQHIANPNLLLDTDTIALGAALRSNGAYQSLAGLGPRTDFNERILLVIGNRGFDQDGCGEDLVQKAGAAFTSSGIRTYVVLRDKSKPQPDTQIGPALAISDAGGGVNGNQFFDSRPDDEAAVGAITRVVAQLGTCLYTNPGGIVSSATLSYYDPINLKEVKIEHTDSSCDASTPPDAPGGWAASAGQIRICGKPCSSLRDTLQNVAKLNVGVLKQASQAIPIHPVVCNPQ